MTGKTNVFTALARQLPLVTLNVIYQSVGVEGVNSFRL